MRITHYQGEHLVALTAPEAARLVDACALLVLAAESVPGSPLAPEMATLLCELFDGLKSTAGSSSPAPRTLP
jgi:hypothetical protein